MKTGTAVALAIGTVAVGTGVAYLVISRNADKPIEKATAAGNVFTIGLKTDSKEGVDAVGTTLIRAMGWQDSDISDGFLTLDAQGNTISVTLSFKPTFTGQLPATDFVFQVSGKPATVTYVVQAPASEFNALS